LLDVTDHSQALALSIPPLVQSGGTMQSLPMRCRRGWNADIPLLLPNF